MIDFRYHLVSIIAIFLALAIGIVLGAGPLKEDIGTTLSSEVTKLRAEKADLNTQLSDAKSDQQAAMTYGAATLPLVVNGRLKGQTVALVAGPDSPTDLVDDVADAVVAAGGQVGPRVRLTKDMISTSGAQARSEQVASIAAAAKVTAGDAADLPAVLLARSVVSGGASAPVYDETFGPTVLPKLKSAGLLQYSEGAPGPATSSILVAGPVSSDSAEQTTAEQKSYLRIVGALDRVGRGPSPPPRPRRPRPPPTPGSPAASSPPCAPTAPPTPPCRPSTTSSSRWGRPPRSSRCSSSWSARWVATG
ncbi:hypothetical protein GCM10025862_10490 [Arsenicicoccus piscis]|uniref:Copper transporter n=1 Tax=Arsenicicoccus piscis TaxID=673954 RepID=A0ABQ6HMX6_9MICO|nr:copper transporter [Arsenicicoccus piscis]GMA19028.1 hypothetical protein GCM10025862_10490 [Arsenicicoccus piscis]